MTEILRCPLVPEAEPDVTGIGDRWHVYAVEGPDWLVDGPERSTPAEAIAVWNEAMRKLGAKEGEG